MDFGSWFPRTHRRAIADSDAMREMADVAFEPEQGLPPIADKAPSSVYHGEVFFFDSVEHRDLFNANGHRPVAIDSELIGCCGPISGDITTTWGCGIGGNAHQ